MKPSFDHLKILTKSQMIKFLKQESFLRAPEKRSVDSFLYQEKIEANLKKREAHSESGGWTTDAANEADRLADEYNREKDHAKAHRIFMKRQTIIKKLQNHWEESSKIDAEYDKIEKLYGIT